MFHQMSCGSQHLCGMLAFRQQRNHTSGVIAQECMHHRFLQIGDVDGSICTFRWELEHLRLQEGYIVIVDSHPQIFHVEFLLSSFVFTLLQPASRPLFIFLAYLFPQVLLFFLRSFFPFILFLRLSLIQNILNKIFAVKTIKLKNSPNGKKYQFYLIRTFATEVVCLIDHVEHIVWVGL